MLKHHEMIVRLECMYHMPEHSQAVVDTQKYIDGLSCPAHAGVTLSPVCRATPFHQAV